MHSHRCCACLQHTTVMQKSSIWYPASIRLLRVDSDVAFLPSWFNWWCEHDWKVSLEWDWNRGPPDPQPDALTSAPSRHVVEYEEVEELVIRYMIRYWCHQNISLISSLVLVNPCHLETTLKEVSTYFQLAVEVAICSEFVPRRDIADTRPNHLTLYIKTNATVNSSHHHDHCLFQLLTMKWFWWQSWPISYQFKLMGTILLPWGMGRYSHINVFEVKSNFRQNSEEHMNWTTAFKMSTPPELCEVHNQWVGIKFS